MDVLDLESLDEDDYQVLDELWRDIESEDFSPFPAINNDPFRARIDDAFADILGVSGFDVLRDHLAREPVVTDEPIT